METKDNDKKNKKPTKTASAKKTIKKKEISTTEKPKTEKPTTKKSTKKKESTKIKSETTKAVKKNNKQDETITQIVTQETINKTHTDENKKTQKTKKEVPTETQEVKGKSKKKKRRLKWYTIVGIIFAVIVSVVLVFVFANSYYANQLLKYIDTFEAVEYTNQLVPTIDEETGFYTFTTDEEFKVMQITDLHIGGGLSSEREDRKTIYELICMLQQEKPDLVILTGDNVFPVPGPIFNGGGTMNNLMVSKIVIEIFEHEHVYFTTTFGNHDAEIFDYYDRNQIGNLYMRNEYKYCIFNKDFSDEEASQPSITNQCILVKNTQGEISKALMLLDSNAYVNNSIKAVLDWNYDVIHDAQVDWAYNTLTSLKEQNNNQDVKSLFFFHIPIGEYEEAYRDLEEHDFQNTDTTEYISGAWDEVIDNELGGRIWYGGCSNKTKTPAECDSLFERLGPDDLNSMEACFCGHDHTNNTVVNYKGVILSYNNTMDNLAYEGLCHYGSQRGCTVITIQNDGTWGQQHKLVYVDYDIDANKFYQQKDGYYSEGYLPNN